MSKSTSAFDRLVEWIDAANGSSPMISPVAGISNSDLPRLTRLGAIIVGIFGHEMPQSLAEALTPGRPIKVPDSVKADFLTLIETDGSVRLADLYATVVSSTERRNLGTFFTPRVYAQTIVDGYSDRYGAPSSVVDVGAGVGIFSHITRLKWADARITAIDINPLTLGLQAVMVIVDRLKNMDLVLDDYSRWIRDSVPQGPTLYLGNPPYTRWQLIDQYQRLDLLEAADGLAGARANLSTLFVAMTLARLRPEDSLAMIIPAGWMHADYGKSLRRRIRSESHRRISLRLADSWRFDEAIVDAVLVEIGPELDSEQPIQVADWAGSEILEVTRSTDDGPFERPGYQRQAPVGLDGNSNLVSNYARVVRGTATGANAFFIRPPETWNSLGIPGEYRKAVARRIKPSSDGSNPVIELAELLVLEGYQRGTDRRVDGVISEGELLGLPELYLCSKRSRWFDLTMEVRVPSVILSAFGRDRFHVVDNPDGLAIVNNLFGLYWLDSEASESNSRLTRWLQTPEGQSALMSASSIEANGLHRLSPRKVKSIPFPEFDECSEAEPGAFRLLEKPNSDELWVGAT